MLINTEYILDIFGKEIRVGDCIVYNESRWRLGKGMLIGVFEGKTQYGNHPIQQYSIQPFEQGAWSKKKYDSAHVILMPDYELDKAGTKSIIGLRKRLEKEKIKAEKRKNKS